jgi:probable HAF family extracellular repeat protein
MKQALFTLCILLGTASGSTAGLKFTVTELPTLGGDYGEASHINNRGVVTGQSVDANGVIRAYVWEPGAGIKRIGLDGEENSAGLGINDSGTITGISGLGAQRLLLWDRRGGPRVVATPDGNAAYGVEINVRGEVAGYRKAGTRWQAFVYSADGWLDVGPAGSDSGAYGINNLGSVVGAACTSATQCVGFVAERGNGFKVLVGLGGSYTCAEGINDAGEITGVSTAANGEQHAFFYDDMNGMVDLGHLGGRASYGMAVNNRGQVVGFSQAASGATHAFLWDRSTGMVDIHPAGWLTSQALSINESGQVVGVGTNAQGKVRAFVLDVAREK